MTPSAARHLGEAVACDGLGAHRSSIAVLLDSARRRGVNPVLVAVAGDPSAPPVARERALGRVVVEYCRPVHRGARPKLGRGAPAA